MKTEKKVLLFASILLCLILGSSAGIFAQSGLQMSVYGQIREFDSNKPLADVGIEIFRFENEEIVDVKSSKSDKNGYFKIRFLKKGQYEFSIDIPNIGRLYIDFIPSKKNHYQLEINDGQNIELNVFLGEYLFPYIDRKDSLDKSVVDITMFYSGEMVQDEIVRDSKAFSSLSSPCDPLYFNYWCPIFTEPDNFPLIFKENVRGITITYQNYKGKDYDCIDDKCKYNYSIVAGGCIVIRSPQWHATNLCKSQSIECGECYYECAKKHELVHWEDYKNCYVPIACKYIEKLKNIPANCDCREEWIRECLKKYIEFKGKLDREFRQCYKTSESNAHAVSDPCDEKCDYINNGG